MEKGGRGKTEKKPAGMGGRKGGGEKDTWRPELVATVVNPVLVPNKARDFKATDPRDRVFQLYPGDRRVRNS